MIDYTLREEAKKIVDLMLDYLFNYSSDVKVHISLEENRLLIEFVVEALDEGIRARIMRTIKGNGTTYSFSENILEIAKHVSDIRMETTDDETKILFIKNC